MECPIKLYIANEEVSPSSLASQSLNTSGFSLIIKNSRNQTLDLDFFPTRDVFSQDVQTLPSTSNSTHSCHFDHVSNGLHSAISLCSNNDVSGIISTSKNYFVLDTKYDEFLLLPQTSKNCDLPQAPHSRLKRDAKKPVENKLPDYYKEYNDGKWRYVELALVADNSIYKKYESSDTKVHDRMKTIAQFVNSLYYPLNIRIHLVWVNIWKEGDSFSVATSGDKTLEHFLAYRKTIMEAHPNDNAHFLTDVRFESGVVGKAYKGTMCSYDFSGGVNVDHTANPAGVAATMAHEMGHNFGMDHDVDYTSTCECPGQHCIMAPSTGTFPPDFWSTCSLDYLNKGFQRGVDLCLQNAPEAPAGGATCGNGVLEKGEDCDCGREVCIYPCCDGKTCKLAENAECAVGDCCDLFTCKHKPRATQCRAATNICDLPEFCNGDTNQCPADFFVQDGHVCPDRKNEFCFDGVCGSNADQCHHIWGETGKPAIPQCFTELNKAGTLHGNCGFDPHKQTFTRCTNEEDSKCGRLHCATTRERPVLGDNTVQSAYSYIYVGRETHQCHVIKPLIFGGGAKDKLDIGMVRDGAQCGNGKVCMKAKCKPLQEVTKTTSKCNNDCNFRGTCNNMGNCHCENGYGGISCEIPGYGGSVNSNPANLSRGLTPTMIFGLILFMLFFVFVGYSVYQRKKNNRNIPKELYKYMRSTFELHGQLEPVRKAPPPPGGKQARKRDQFNAAWGDATVQYSTTDKPPPIVPPTIPIMSLNASQPSSTTYQTYDHSPRTARNVQVSLGRSPSLRPKEPPPMVPLRPPTEQIQKLYEERGEELGLCSSTGQKSSNFTPDDPSPSSPLSEADHVVYRPVEAPPPPPPKHYKNTTNEPLLQKPAVPTKPPVAHESFLDSKTNVSPSRFINKKPLDENGQPLIVKPEIPKKPPISSLKQDSEEGKIDVKGLAAKFDAQRKGK